MKTLYFTIAICSLFSFSAISQTFTWETSNTIETNLALNTTVQHPMYQSAVGTDTVTLAIEVIYNDIPATWDGMLCIYGACLGTIPPVGTQATMTPLFSPNQGMVRLTVNPMNGTETATLQVYVYDVDFPNDGDTATWLLNTTVSVDENVWNDLSVYPNPTSDIVTLSSDKQIELIEIYSMKGQLVARFTDPLTSDIDMSSLEEGAYLLKLVQPNGESTVRKIQKL